MCWTGRCEGVCDGGALWSTTEDYLVLPDHCGLTNQCHGTGHMNEPSRKTESQKTPQISNTLSCLNPMTVWHLFLNINFNRVPTGYFIVCISSCSENKNHFSFHCLAEENWSDTSQQLIHTSTTLHFICSDKTNNHWVICRFNTENSMWGPPT